MSATVEVQERRVNIVQGEYSVSADPNVVFTTILGSCVAACIRDPSAGVGGLNHFLLPGNENGAKGADVERYGVHLMELLVNGLMKMGARRDRLEAKLFGGAKMMERLSDVGKLNASFAERFLQHEGIRMVGGSLGGEQGRRIQFWPVSGRARQFMMPLDRAFVNPPPAKVLPPARTGDIELF
jgi:chemotaxis protein CheD